MSAVVYKSSIKGNRFFGVVRSQGDKFIFSTKHVLFGDLDRSEHDTEFEAIEACDQYVAQAKLALDVLPQLLLNKYGPGIVEGAGPEKILEIVEKNEANLDSLL